jgi:hypothetical protein
MAAEHDMTESHDDRLRSGRRFSLSGLLNAALSVTFIVLAAYIAIYASKPGVPDSRNLLYFSALMGAYGIWRMIRTVLKNRAQNECAE